MTDERDRPFSVAQHFRRWLRAGMTGCLFARQLARRGDLAVAVADESANAAQLDTDLDFLAEEKKSVAIVVPSISSERGLVSYLEKLQRESGRWRVFKRTHPEVDGSVCLVGLEWSTSDGMICDLMGFAPFPVMPATRRGPYVAIAGWPGGRENPFRFRPKDPSRVSFLDVRHGMEREAYDAAWEGSERQVAELLENPADNPRRYRDVAFVVSGEHSGLVEQLAGADAADRN
jgi:NAD(P)-dependent dehydrogenase (short-subunit alcohol dehydrogenase family)